jgi:exonuclease VII large subunit
LSDGKFIKPTNVKGYSVVRLRFNTARGEKEQKKFDLLTKQKAKLAKKLKTQIENKESKKLIAETAKELKTFSENLSQKFIDDFNERTIRFNGLVHRLVAANFLKKPKTKAPLFVTHLDHNKQNNRADNLKWVTLPELVEHQMTNPRNIEQKRQRKLHPELNRRNVKLSVEQVMQLKKLMNQGKPMRELVMQFKVTETQLWRIKKGENWGLVKAAK